MKSKVSTESIKFPLENEMRITYNKIALLLEHTYAFESGEYPCENKMTNGMNRKARVKHVDKILRQCCERKSKSRRWQIKA